jgi:putative transposase
VIEAKKAEYEVGMMCELLGVKRSSYYAWEKRRVAALEREARDETLRVQVLDVFRRNRGVYGSPRVQRELERRGFHVGRHRVAGLMRELGLQARRARRFRATTDSSHTRPVAPNLLEQQFRVSGPDAVWVADLTCLWTHEGWLYLAVILDLFSRKVVGWAMDDNMCTEVPLRALTMALTQRRPAQGLIHHSDRGSQYASDDYRKALDTAGARTSMSRKGNCYDNAVAESFFSTIEAELECRCVWNTRQDASLAVFEYIEAFYNSRRKHSTLGYLSPVEFEALAMEGNPVAA